MSTSSIDLNLGIDFGTKFTKVCFRDTSLEKSWAVTFESDKLEKALILSQIAICKNGTLLAGLTEYEWQQKSQNISILIDYVKMRLASLDLIQEGISYPSDSLSTFSGYNLNNPDILENLCAYYLACVIKRTQDWVQEYHNNLIKNQQVNWSGNVGVPVKYCDSAAIARFNKVVRLASVLAGCLPKSFNDLQARMIEIRASIDYSKIPYFAIPEISAGVYSYTASRQARDGVYMFFDIGSGTIEGAAFRFWRENGMPKMDFYAGEVEALGVNALAKSINTKDSNLSETQIVNDIISSQKLLNAIETKIIPIISTEARNGDFIANKYKITVRAIHNELENHVSLETKKLLYLMLEQSSIHRLVAEVVMTSKAKNREYFQQSPNLRLFLGGGGRESEFYQDTIESTHCTCNHHHAGVPPYSVEELPFPDGFDMGSIQKNYFHRFAVAYGLSIPEAEAPEFRLPSRLPYQPPRAVQPITPQIGRYPDDNSSM